MEIANALSTQNGLTGTPGDGPTPLDTKTIRSGSITFTATTPFDAVGLDVAGKPWAVLSDGTADVTITPAPSTDSSGNRTGEAMLNPVAGTASSTPQGLDQRGGAKFDPGLAVAQPVTVGAGDILLVTVPEPDYVQGDRSGMFAEIAALHILSAPPPANALLHASVGWEGRTAPGYEVFDVDAWYAARPVYPAPPGLPTADALLTAFDKFYPTFALANTYLANATGYQDFSPRYFGHQSGHNRNYGRGIAALLENIAIGLVTDAFSEDDTKRLARRVAQLGMELYQPFKANNDLVLGEGGHLSWFFFPVAFMLHATGQSAEIDTAFGIVPGNFSQAFEITAEIRNNDLVPHSAAKKPSIFRLRTLGPQPGGTTVEIPVASADGDDSQVYIPAGAILTRPSDGATAIVTQEARLATSGTVTATIDAQPSPPISSGDTIYFDVPEGWKAIGTYDWLKGSYARGTYPNPENYSPAASNSYRSLQAWAAQIMVLDLMGAWPESGAAAKGYMVRAMISDEPAPFNDYPDVSQSWIAADGSGMSASNAFFGSVYAGSPSVRPSQFMWSDWSAAAAGDGEIAITVADLPDVGGPPTRIEVSLSGGAWTDTGLTGVGTATLASPAGPQTIRLRAVNPAGPGLPSSERQVPVSGG